MSIFMNAGQACVAGSRILVQREIYQEFLVGFKTAAAKWPVGSPFHRASRMDPLVSKRQYDRVTDYPASAKKDGRVLFGGGRPQELVGLPDTSLGYFIEPTAIVDIDNGARACQEEIFDPVATIIPFGARSAYCQ